jgi:two-component system, NarL family, response regulator LiaR
LRVVLIDDHALFRVGVRKFLEAIAGHKIVGEAGTARTGFRVVDSLQPEVVLMDIVLPGMDGVVATREIMRRAPDAKVVILSAHDRVRDVRDALNAGAAGYVLKADGPETLQQALDSIRRGVRYVAPSLVDQVTALEAQPPRSDFLDVLSEREREIFRLAADCQTAAEISRELCLARKTVDTHLNRIHRKLGLRDRAELVRLAASAGLVHAIRGPNPSPPARWRSPDGIS